MHLDNNTQNNIDTNLQWGTCQENSDYRTLCGHNVGAHKGSKHHYAKLKDSDIPKIRKLLDKKVPVKIIAEKFKVSTEIIYHVRNGSCWGHIK